MYTFSILHPLHLHTYIYTHMDTWDSRFTFTADEANLFARLHNKATKFPIPEGILVAETETVTEKDVELAEIAEIVVDSQTA